jgi:hypothetical protein
VSKDGLHMDPKKLKKKLEWRTPRSVIKLRGLNGTAIFYRKFIKGFDKICSSMIE